jgi:tetratricopeptide (TPR) repeat protein
MASRSYRALLILFTALFAVVDAHGQGTSKSAKIGSVSANASKPPASAVEASVDLAAKGQCEKALPILKRSVGRISDKDLKYRAAMATARCAMSLEQTETAVNALTMMQRDFPDDPQVLYIATHYFSELATRASQRLAVVAPTSYQTHELEAEADESQGKWDDALAEYREILKQNQEQPGIHYRMGRVCLSAPETATSTDEAAREFEAELKIDPTNASAEFFLGEIARRAGRWDEAVPHFSKASTLDPGFSEAFLALGMSLNSSQKFADALAPLEKYVKMEPADPAGHYQLSLSYSQTGRKDEAAREMSAQQEMARKGAASGGAAVTPTPR